MNKAFLLIPLLLTACDNNTYYNITCIIDGEKRTFTQISRPYVYISERNIIITSYGRRIFVASIDKASCVVERI